MPLTESYRRKKLKRYYRRDPPDPLKYLEHDSPPKLKKLKLLQVAGAVKHYGSMLTSHPSSSAQKSYSPELLDEIKLDRRYHWSKDLRYRLCLYQERSIIQVGDVITTLNRQKGIVDYFFWDTEPMTRGERRKVKLVVSEVLNRSDLPPLWRAFVQTDDALLVNTQTTWDLHLALIRSVTPRDQVKLSPYVFHQNRLRERDTSTEHTDELISTMIYTYLSTKSNLLHLHPLVKHAALYLDLLFSPEVMSQMIQKHFFPWNEDFRNDDDDDMNFDQTELTILHRTSLKDGLCKFCRNETKLVVCHLKEGCCEKCYVRMRYLYQLFLPLERTRLKVRRQKVVLADDHETLNELTDMVTKLLPALRYTNES